jgi:hypothetical protein
MAYTILNTDGTLLVLLPDGTIDQSTTSLTLIGKNYSGFGQYYNENLITLLANSANTSDVPPISPITGQLWYDTTNKKLKIYDGIFKPINGAIVSNVQPSMAAGDIWWDTTNQQLKLYDGANAQTIGPAFPNSVGSNGWVLPGVKIQDNGGNNQNVTLLNSFDTTIGYITTSSFNVNASSNYDYITPGTTTSTVAGLTILGDIQYSGKILNNYLSMNIEMTTLVNSPNSQDLSGLSYNDLTYQNSLIASVLDAMFPVNTSTNSVSNLYNSDSVEVGVPVRSQARVLCSSSTQPGKYQVRVFEAGISVGVGRWADKVISSNTTTNILYDFNR